MKKHSAPRCGNNKDSFGNKKGFTLVEAITTLVILAIVAAVSIPSLVGYIDSSRKKIAVQECSAVVEAANALGVEHVLETGVVNYDEVVPLADTSEPGKSVYSSVTKEAILKRAELEDKGEIKNFSFDPNDSGGYSQPAYLVNKEEVVVSAAADITLAKNIVSPLAVSVEKTTDTEFKEAAGISLTSLEYTASNGIDVVYHNGGYQASSKVDIDFEHHNLIATVKQVLTCDNDEIVEFKCTGINCPACDEDDENSKYRVMAVTAFAPGHNYGALTCVGKDKHEQTCTNVLNRLAKGDKALNAGDELDLEPQYDIYNLPRVGVECETKIDEEHFGDITEDVELTKGLERDIPFSLDGVYKSSGEVPAGKYTVKTCSGCGYSEYVAQMPDGLVIIDNNNDNVADKATISKESIESGDPLVFETVSEAVKYLGSASVGNSQVIKLLGNVTETEAVNVKGKILTHITITSRNGNRYTWKGVDLHFASETQADSSITLENIVIDNGNAAQIPVQASYGVTILGNGATIKNVKDCAVELTGGTFEMHDGAVITNCSSSKNSGGAISASTNGGTINLYGGIVENCSCVGNGGAICVNSKTTLNIKGNPVVVNNTATQKGNNIYLESGKTLNVVGDISGTKTIGIVSADDVRNQVSGEFGVNENTGYLNGKVIAAFKNDVNDSLHAEVKDGKVIWAKEVQSNGATGNWDNRDENGNHIPSDWEDFHPEGGENGGKVRISVTGNPNGDYSSLGATKNFSTQGAQVKIENETDHYLKSFEFKFRFTYSKKVDWIDDYGVVHYKDDDTPLDLSDFSSTLTKDLYWTFEADNINNTITVKSTKKYTDDVLNINHNTAPVIGGKSTFCFALQYGATLDNSVCLYLDEANVEFVYDKDYYAKLNVNYTGDLSKVKRVEVQNARSMIRGTDVFYPEPNKTVNPLVTPSYALCTNGTNGDDAVVILYGDNNVELSRAYIKQQVLLETVQKDRYGNGVIEVDCPATSKFNFKAVFDRSKIGAIELKNGDGSWLRGDGCQQMQSLNKNEYTWVGLDLRNLPNGLQLITYGKDQAGNANWNDNRKIQITYNELKTYAERTFVYTVDSSSETEPSTEAVENTEPTETTTEVPGTTEPKPTTPTDIPEPAPNELNILIEYDCELKEDVKIIEISQNGNILSKFSVDTDEKVYVVENAFNGFVISNYKLPFEYSQWYQPSFDLLLKNADGVEIGRTIVSGDQYYPGIVDGTSVNNKIQPTAIKLNITYTGSNYSNIRCLKIGDDQYQYHNVLTSGNLGEYYFTPLTGQNLSIVVLDQTYNVMAIRDEIPWSQLEAALGRIMNITI